MYIIYIIYRLVKIITYFLLTFFAVSEKNGPSPAFFYAAFFSGRISQSFVKSYVEVITIELLLL